MTLNPRWVLRVCTIARLTRCNSFPFAAFVVAVNCWSVTLASRTQVTLTFIKMFALVLIIVPGVIALAKGLELQAVARLGYYLSFCTNSACNV